MKFGKFWISWAYGFVQLDHYSEEFNMCILCKRKDLPSVQFSLTLSSDSLFVTSGIAAGQASLSFTTPGAYSSSGPLSWWCHPTISPSLIPFSSCLQSFPASGSFQMSWFFPSGGQSIEDSAFSISPSNEYSELIFFRMDWLDLLAVQGTLKSLLQHQSSKASILQSHIHTWLLEKP